LTRGGCPRGDRAGLRGLPIPPLPARGRDAGAHDADSPLAAGTCAVAAATAAGAAGGKATATNIRAVRAAAAAAEVRCVLRQRVGEAVTVILQC
jgi:hypothetical protein